MSDNTPISRMPERVEVDLTHERAEAAGLTDLLKELAAGLARNGPQK